MMYGFDCSLTKSEFFVNALILGAGTWEIFGGGHVFMGEDEEGYTSIEHNI